MSATYTGSSRFENFAMTMPFDNGSICVPQQITFDTQRNEIDLSELVSNGWLDWIAGVYIDNTANDGYLFFECFGTNQKFYFPGKASGYVPLFMPNPPKAFVTHSTGGAVQFQWYNVPVFPCILRGPTNSASETVDIISVGGVPIVGGNLPVIGPLTNTELRANPVPVIDAGTTFVDHSILNLSGVSQSLMAANANRTMLVIQNVAANNMGINFVGGTAAIGVAGTITLTPGNSVVFDSNAPTNAITIIGTLNDDVTAYEG